MTLPQVREGRRLQRGDVRVWGEDVSQVWQTHGSATLVSAVAAAAHVVRDPQGRPGRQATPASPLPRPPLQVRPQQTLLEDELEENQEKQDHAEARVVLLLTLKKENFFVLL